MENPNKELTMDEILVSFKETMDDFKKKATGLMLAASVTIIIQCLVIVWLVIR